MGNIVCVFKDGMLVDICYMCCNFENGEWDMNDLSFFVIILLVYGLFLFILLFFVGVFIVYVVWFFIMYMVDLVVIDVFGCISIFFFLL